MQFVKINLEENIFHTIECHGSFLFSAKFICNKSILHVQELSGGVLELRFRVAD